MRVDLVGVNAYKVPLRTKKIDMTPIRLEGDEDGDGDDGDSGGDEDEDEDEESTPVPRSKRHVAPCVFLLPYPFQVCLPRITSALCQKNYYCKVCSHETKIPSKRSG